VLSFLRGQQTRVAPGCRRVDGQDLLAALESGQLSAAVLDVFEQEPLPREHPFWRHQKVIVTPHAAAATHAPTAAAGVAENLRRLRAGRPLINLVDPASGY